MQSAPDNFDGSSPPMYTEYKVLIVDDEPAARRAFEFVLELIQTSALSHDYAGLHVGPKTALLRETLNNLEVRLDPKKFIRIHRSTIIQVSRIRELQTLPNRDLRLRLTNLRKLAANSRRLSHFGHRMSLFLQIKISRGIYCPLSSTSRLATST